MPPTIISFYKVQPTTTIYTCYSQLSMIILSKNLFVHPSSILRTSGPNSYWNQLLVSGYNHFSPRNIYDYWSLTANAFPSILLSTMDYNLFGFDSCLYPMAATNSHLPEKYSGAHNGHKRHTISESGRLCRMNRKSESSLERNRQAAKRYRKKKNKYTDQMEKHFQDAKLRKEILEAEVSQMKGEILFLKDILLRHSQCGDDNIKSYLSRMLTRLTGRIAPTFRGDASIEESSMLLLSQFPGGGERLSVDSSASSEFSTTFLDTVVQVDWESTVSTINNNESELARDIYWDNFIDFS